MTYFALLNLHNALASYLERQSAKFIRQEMYIISAPRGNLAQRLQAFYYHHRTKTSNPPVSLLGQICPQITYSFHNSH